MKKIKSLIFLSSCLLSIQAHASIKTVDVFFDPSVAANSVELTLYFASDQENFFDQWFGDYKSTYPTNRYSDLRLDRSKQAWISTLPVEVETPCIIGKDVQPDAQDLKLRVAYNKDLNVCYISQG